MAYTLLTHPTDTELAAAVQENLYALFRSMQILPGYELVESDVLSYHHAFPTNPMFKGVWRARLSLEEVEDIIDMVLAWFKHRRAPYLFWWIDPQTQPTDLTERLIRRGFDGNMTGDPGMAVALYALNENIQGPEDFTVVQAVDQRTLEHWRNVFAASYKTPASAGQAWVDATVYADRERAAWKMYVGYLKNKPVATAILFNGAGVAGIYGVGVIPEARGQGIGATITLKPLLEAREQGYRYAVLFSTKMGYPVYRRLGFREVTSKIGIYMLERN